MMFFRGIAVWCLTPRPTRTVLNHDYKTSSGCRLQGNVLTQAWTTTATLAVSKDRINRSEGC